MRFLKKIFCAAVLCGVAVAAMASPSAPKNGVEYLTMPTPQPADAGKKVEVIEFFAYYCPHCNSFEPSLEAWIKKQGNNIVFKRVHVPYDESTAAQQRLYFTLEALGLVDQYQAKVFQAIHVDRQPLKTDAEVLAFITTQGIDPVKFKAAYTSFGVTARIHRASSMMASYGIDSWPAIIVDGRYKTSPAQAGTEMKDVMNEGQLHVAVLTVMDALVAKVQAEKK